jgi:hypothetical protein
LSGFGVNRAREHASILLECCEQIDKALISGRSRHSAAPSTRRVPRHRLNRSNRRRTPHSRSQQVVADVDDSQPRHAGNVTAIDRLVARLAASTLAAMARHAIAPAPIKRPHHVRRPRKRHTARSAHGAWISRSPSRHSAIASPYSANDRSRVDVRHAAHSPKLPSPTLVLFLRRRVGVDVEPWRNGVHR